MTRRNLSLKDNWLEAAQANLLPLSREQTDLKRALEEWEHTGKVIDHGAAVENCQLCDRQQLRYHFEIFNRFTSKTKMVGSSCIKKFDIIVFDDHGNKLEGEVRERWLKKEIAERQKEMMLEPLRELWSVAEECRDIIEWCLDGFESLNGFSPARLCFLFQQMGEREIKFNPPLYKIVLRSYDDKMELVQLTSEELTLIWPSLSPQQKRRYEAHKKKLEQLHKRSDHLEGNAPRSPALMKFWGRSKAPSFSSDVSWGAGISQPAKSFEVDETICMICGKSTRDWWYFDGASNKCKCRDCRDHLSSM